MRTLIRDVTAITLDDEERILSHTAIGLEDAEIAGVGEPPAGFERDLEQDLWAEAWERVQALAEGHNDMIGASAAHRARDC